MLVSGVLPLDAIPGVPQYHLAPPNDTVVLDSTDPAYAKSQSYLARILPPATLSAALPPVQAVWQVSPPVVSQEQIFAGMLKTCNSLPTKMLPSRHLHWTILLTGQLSNDNTTAKAVRVFAALYHNAAAFFTVPVGIQILQRCAKLAQSQEQ